MNLIRATATIGGLTLVSRVLGFLRDMLMARFVGAGSASVPFLPPSRLPTLSRPFFPGGPFASAFVPIFTRPTPGVGGGLRAGVRFAEHVLSVLVPVLLLFPA